MVKNIKIETDDEHVRHDGEISMDDEYATKTLVSQIYDNTNEAGSKCLQNELMQIVQDQKNEMDQIHLL